MSMPFDYNIYMRKSYENEIVNLTRVLSDQVRVKILLILKEGRNETYSAPPCTDYPMAICPTDLQLKLGKISSSKLSYHLKLLKEEGFIQEHREGKRIYYYLQPARFHHLIEVLESFTGNSKELSDETE